VKIGRKGSVESSIEWNDGDLNFTDIPNDISHLSGDDTGYLNQLRTDGVEAGITAQPSFTNTIRNINATTTAEEFFIKDELVDLGNLVGSSLGNNREDTYEIHDLWVSGNLLHLELESATFGYIIPAEIVIDMRKIRKPSDINKYAQELIDLLQIEIKSMNVNSSIITGIEAPLDPPDTFEYDEVSFVGQIQIDVEGEIVITDDGELDTSNDNYTSWNLEAGSWGDTGLEDQLLRDSVTVAEYFYELLLDKYEDAIPVESGTYTLIAAVTLVFDVSGLDKEREGSDDDFNIQYHSEFTEIELNELESSISNLRFLRVS